MRNPEEQNEQYQLLEMPEYVRVLRDEMLTVDSRANLPDLNWSHGEAFADQDTVVLPVPNQTPQK